MPTDLHNLLHTYPQYYSTFYEKISPDRKQHLGASRLERLTKSDSWTSLLGLCREQSNLNYSRSAGTPLEYSHIYKKFMTPNFLELALGRVAEKDKRSADQRTAFEVQLARTLWTHVSSLTLSSGSSPVLAPVLSCARVPCWVLTEYGEQECRQQQQKAGVVGVGGAAVHLVLLTHAHVNFDLCVVGQRGHPWVGDDQRELVVGFLQTVQKHDLGMCCYRRQERKTGDGSVTWTDSQVNGCWTNGQSQSQFFFCPKQNIPYSISSWRERLDHI